MFMQEPYKVYEHLKGYSKDDKVDILNSQIIHLSFDSNELLKIMTVS